MRSTLLTIPFLLIALASAASLASAQPIYKPLAPADYKVPVADLEKWAARLRRLCPAKDWTVRVEGNDVLIQYDKPVKFSGLIYNLPPNSPRMKGLTRDRVFRLKLSFEPLITLDKYEELEAENWTKLGEVDALLKKHGVFERYGEIYDSDGDKGKKQAYLKEAKQIIFHRLPDYYTPEYSLKLEPSSDRFEFLDSGDKNVDASCTGVELAVTNFFGSYFQQALRRRNPAEGEMGRPKQPTPPPPLPTTN